MPRSDLLEQHGFVWDSSLMGRDFEAYRPRPVVVVDEEAGNRFGPPSPIIEIPGVVVPRRLPRPGAPPAERRHGLGRRPCSPAGRTQFDFAYERVPGGVYALTVHPQTIGRAHAFVMFERFVEYVTGHPGAWITTLGEIASTWCDVDES